MKPNKKIAALAVAALATSGIAVIAAAGSAQASSQTFTLYSQINNTALAGPALVGAKNVQMTVTPTSGPVGSSIEVSLTSTDLAFANGPAAASPAGGAELDAVISLNGVDYTLRGSQSGQTVNTGVTNTIFNSGWVVSSTAGNSASTSTNISPASTVAGTTGIGATVRGTEGTPVSLVAPGSAGTYTIGLKALVNNSISGSGTALLTDSFDNIYNTDSSNWNAGCGASGAGCAGNVGPGGPTGSFATNAGNGLTAGAGNIIFTTPVTFLAIGPNGTIATSQGQNAGVQAIRTSPAYSTAVTLTGNTFATAVAAGSVTAQFCNVTGVTCDTPVPGITVNTLTTSAGGVLSGGFTIQGSLTSGNRAIKVTAGASVALIPVQVLATTISISPSSGGPGTVVAVSGSGFNPSQAGIVRGAITNAPPFTTTGDPSSAFTADALGNLASTNFTVNAVTTAAVLASQGPGFPLGPNNASSSQAFTVNLDQCTADTGNVNTGNCNTKQNVYATVLAGNLSQQASVAGGNPSDTAIVFCKYAPPVLAADAAAVQPGNTAACGLASPIAATSMFGTLNTVTVTDTRGGNFGWSLTATMPNLSDGTHSIANGNVAITPSCASVNAGSAPGAVAGAAAQTYAGTVSLCVKDTQIAVSPGSQTTGGQWAINGPLTLTVPAFQAAGQYNSTMTVNLA